ncbi:MAG TPA: hypothetical protein VGL97_14810 [Bryobacteraceae bacterium]|jgi:hypothetical protein
MANAETDREIATLRDTLDAYHDKATTGQLYELSRYLLEEIVERVSRLDASASQLASFAGAILALMLSTYSTWHDPIAHSQELIGLVLSAVGCLALAGWYAFKAIRVAHFDWISDRAIVFPAELLDYPDTLQRYHILAIYRSVLSHEEISHKKARCIFLSQNYFIIGAALLALCLLVILVQPSVHGLLAWFDNRLAWRNF